MKAQSSSPNTKSPQALYFIHQLSPAQPIRVCRSNTQVLEFSPVLSSTSRIQSPVPCRICLELTSEPLISPCNCKGTHSFLHSSCLKTWMLSHSHPTSCELCLSPYNISIQYKRKCKFAAYIWIPLMMLSLTILSILFTTIYFLSVHWRSDPFTFSVLSFFTVLSILLTAVSIYLIAQECFYKEIDTLAARSTENTLDLTVN